jgi:hypothetical protein
MLRYGPAGGEKSEGGETEEVDTTVDTEVEADAGGGEEIADET